MWSLHTFSETRHFFNTKHERTFLEINPRRNMNSWLALSFPVRATAFHTPNFRTHELRLGVQAITKTSLTKATHFTYRSFLQWDKSLDGGGANKLYWRHKFDFLFRWSPRQATAFENELWHDFAHTFLLDRYRFILSHRLKLSAQNHIYLGYLTQSPLSKGAYHWEKIAVLRLKHLF